MINCHPKGESERNVAVCNQLKQYSEQTFNDCLKGAYNPALTYVINKAIADAKQQAEDEADSERWRTIAGTIVAGAVIVGAGIFCAEDPHRPAVGALVGAEAGFLAEAAGAGFELTLGAEFVTGIASDSFLASRLAALSSEEFLTGIAVRNTLSDLARTIAGKIGSACVPGFAAAHRAAAAAEILPQPHPVRPLGQRAGRQGVRNAPHDGPAQTAGINVAVAKIPGYTDPILGDGYIGAISGSGKHAEERIIDTLRGKGSSRAGRRSSVCSPSGARAWTWCSPLLGEALANGTTVDFAVYYLKESLQELRSLQALINGRGAGYR